MQADQIFFEAKPTKFNVSREVNGPPVKVVEPDRKIPSNINKRKSSVLAIHSANQRLVYRFTHRPHGPCATASHAVSLPIGTSFEHGRTRLVQPHVARCGIAFLDFTTVGFLSATPSQYAATPRSHAL